MSVASGCVQETQPGDFSPWGGLTSHFSQMLSQVDHVTLHSLSHSPAESCGSSQEFFCAAGIAAAGCHARCTKNVRATVGRMPIYRARHVRHGVKLNIYSICYKV